jgi:hypothetical protein
VKMQAVRIIIAMFVTDDPLTPLVLAYVDYVIERRSFCRRDRKTAKLRAFAYICYLSACMYK